LDGSVASAIWVFQVYRQRFELSYDALANWALENRGSNPYVPFGNSTYASTHDEWVAEGVAKERAYGAHLQRKIDERQEKIRRTEKRKVNHTFRIQKYKTRYEQIRVFNEQLAAMDPLERLKAILASNIPLEAIADSQLIDCHAAIEILDEETAVALIKKLDRRKKGELKKLKRSLICRVTELTNLK
jgi:hypothetical protein